MKNIREFLKGEIHVNIIDAIAMASLALVMQISSLLNLHLNSKYFIIISILIWILARVIFMRHIFNKENRKNGD